MALLIIQSEPNIAFYSGDDQPDIAIAYNTLDGFSSLSRDLRIESGTNGTVTVRVAAIEFPTNILRKRAELYVNDELVFQGLVWSTHTSRLTSISIQESAGNRKYTDIVPLRDTSDLDIYAVEKSLPIVYGNSEISPFSYDGSGHLWFIADHAIDRINSVRVNGKEISAYILRTEFENGTISVLETSEQYEDTDTIIVDLDGKLDKDSGSLLATAELVLWDFLANVCGLDVQKSDFDPLRSDHPYRIGGTVSDGRATIQSTINDICNGCGLAWAPSIKSIAVRWPPKDSNDSFLSLDESNTSNVNFTSNSDQIITKLRVLYDYHDGFKEHNGAIELQAKNRLEEYGAIGTTIRYSWIKDRHDAIALGIDYLQYYSKIPYQFNCRFDNKAINLAEKVSILYPKFPADEIVVKSIVVSEAYTSISGFARIGADDTIEKVYDNSRVDASDVVAPYYNIENGILSILVTDENGVSLPGARVTFDESTTRIADSAGWVAIEGDPGKHTLLIQFPGLDDQELEVWLQ